MRALLLNCSPHGKQSHGYRLAAEAIATLVQSSGSGPACEVLERDLAAEPLPPIDRGYAAAITSHASDTAVFDWSEQLIVELEQTDALVINTPMHNFTVSASLKLWIDHVLRIRRTFAATPEGKVGLLRDRPTLVLVGSGGFHSGERARQPDFLTPYLRHALGCVGISSVQFLLLQGLTLGDDAVAAALTTARRELARFARIPRMALFDAATRAT
ncbi:FMN-dependent NADH-azoreductase [Cupriavidus sp. YR651]|uniref:FMN-dependent NADH-azoreductase n=1 Tax=Cupriavidus sp. YR651 TaxID=1855315 RepID=UPI00088561E2|nr:NAD(P)H-dependent oxidoreductase [Cupriavidus sp. YR651]SDD55582.1 FMN-dependent NADH-azoreductase [Cupriavidus sp. YR651]